jgi:hypothetical protein
MEEEFIVEVLSRESREMDAWKSHQLTCGRSEWPVFLCEKRRGERFAQDRATINSKEFSDEMERTFLAENPACIKALFPNYCTGIESRITKKPLGIAQTLGNGSLSRDLVWSFRRSSSDVSISSETKMVVVRLLFNPIIPIELASNRAKLRGETLCGRPAIFSRKPWHLQGW